MDDAVESNDDSDDDEEEEEDEEEEVEEEEEEEEEEVEDDMKSRECIDAEAEDAMQDSKIVSASMSSLPTCSKSPPPQILVPSVSKLFLTHMQESSSSSSSLVTMATMISMTTFTTFSFVFAASSFAAT